MFDVSRTFLLHCSHTATKGDERCTRLHGHTFQITLSCQTQYIDADGFSVDFFAFDKAIADCVERFDHRHLNDLLEHPTCENLARSIYEICDDTLPEIAWIEVDEIGVGKVRYTKSAEES